MIILFKVSSFCYNKSFCLSSENKNDFKKVFQITFVSFKDVCFALGCAYFLKRVRSVFKRLLTTSLILCVVFSLTLGEKILTHSFR
jgi:hypothetical protein